MSRPEDLTFFKSENENALDNFYGAVGFVAFGCRHVVHDGWVHPHSACDRGCVVTDWPYSRSSSGLKMTDERLTR